MLEMLEGLKLTELWCMRILYLALRMPCNYRFFQGLGVELRIYHGDGKNELKIIFKGINFDLKIHN